MKKSFRLYLVLLLVFSLSLAGCGDSAATGGDAPAAELRDYAADITLDMDSETVKQEVTVNTFVDGDTTHFNFPGSPDGTDVIKARYLAIDTPESTGKVEEYGKAASNFTREKLSAASSIIIESDNDQWNHDSTGSRYMVWVWYREKEDEPYRNLNLEILQKGLALASSSANNRYGDICMKALSQAKEQKLRLFSCEPDPDFYYGDAIELTLKELRLNVEEYNGKKVAFNGIVSKHSGNGVYVEAQEPETGLYNGTYIYYGFNLPSEGIEILTVGNEVRIVGTVSYYEVGESYQVSGLSYRAMKPDDPNNIQKLSDGHSAAFVPTTADTFVNSAVDAEAGGESISIDYAEFTMDTSLEMKGLKVNFVYTTSDPQNSSCGAMTLYCEADGIPVTVRTEILKDEAGNIITEDAYMGKTIDVKGIVLSFKGEEQIKVLSAKDITVH